MTILPKAEVVGVLYDPNFHPALDQLVALEKAARSIALRLEVLKHRSEPAELRFHPESHVT